MYLTIEMCMDYQITQEGDHVRITQSSIPLALSEYFLAVIMSILMLVYFGYILIAIHNFPPNLLIISRPVTYLIYLVSPLVGLVMYIIYIKFLSVLAGYFQWDNRIQLLNGTVSFLYILSLVVFIPPLSQVFLTILPTFGPPYFLTFLLVCQIFLIQALRHQSLQVTIDRTTLEVTKVVTLPLWGWSDPLVVSPPPLPNLSYAFSVPSTSYMDSQDSYIPEEQVKKAGLRLRHMSLALMSQLPDGEAVQLVVLERIEKENIWYVAGKVADALDISYYQAPQGPATADPVPGPN